MTSMANAADPAIYYANHLTVYAYAALVVDLVCSMPPRLSAPCFLDVDRPPVAVAPRSFARRPSTF